VIKEESYDIEEHHHIEEVKEGLRKSEEPVRVEVTERVDITMEG
jgi:N-acetyl-gamma-glutamylphosphate reductase